MEGQKKNAGITLVSLVVSIIVMLILAGVSINAVVGENGILTQAQEAAIATELARIKEELEYMFLDFNIGDSDNIGSFLTNKKNDGTIDDFNVYDLNGVESMVIVKDGYYFLVENSSGSYYATLMDESLEGATAKYVIVTQESFDSSSGTMSFDAASSETGEQTVIFYEEISGEMNFEIKSGTVNIYITQDMILTNENMSRSAVDIYTGATLNLYFVGNPTMIVDSGVAQEGQTGTAGTMTTVEGGEGGYAGIHVPEGATLNLYGSGTLYAYGGRASDGGSGVTGTSSSSDWRKWRWPEEVGAGAGIGGNGGKGGDGNSTVNGNVGKIGTTTWIYYYASYTDSGCDGEDGETAGTINIDGDLTVYAYGGGGGSSPLSLNFGTSSGAGGYPAAGIGGRWCWWSVEATGVPELVDIQVQQEIIVP